MTKATAFLCGKLHYYSGPFAFGLSIQSFWVSKQEDRVADALLDTACDLALRVLRVVPISL